MTKKFKTEECPRCDGAGELRRSVTVADKGMPLEGYRNEVCETCSGLGQVPKKTQQAKDDAEEFAAEYGDHGCSCHISPPCSYCCHPGNPLCQEADSCYELADEPEDPLATEMFMHSPAQFMGSGALTVTTLEGVEVLKAEVTDIELRPHQQALLDKIKALGDNHVVFVPPRVRPPIMGYHEFLARMEAHRQQMERYAAPALDALSIAAANMAKQAEPLLKGAHFDTVSAKAFDFTAIEARTITSSSPFVSVAQYLAQSAAADKAMIKAMITPAGTTRYGDEVMVITGNRPDAMLADGLMIDHKYHTMPGPENTDRRFIRFDEATPYRDLEAQAKAEYAQRHGMPKPPTYSQAYARDKALANRARNKRRAANKAANKAAAKARKQSRK